MCAAASRPRPSVVLTEPVGCQTATPPSAWERGSERESWAPGGQREGAASSPTAPPQPGTPKAEESRRGACPVLGRGVGGGRCWGLSEGWQLGARPLGGSLLTREAHFS